MEYNRKRHCVYLLTYHIVFVTQYRKKVIDDEIGKFMKNLSKRLCKSAGGELISAETDQDHIHLLISLPPEESVTKVVIMLKTQLSKQMREQPEFRERIEKQLQGDSKLWGSSYFVASTGSVSMKTVQSYIEAQRTEEHQKRKYVKSRKYGTKRW